MIRLALLPAAVAALLVVPAQAEDQAEAVAASTSVATPVKLVSWDGDFELLKESRRLRIWRSHLAYRLTVDAQGEVTGCELTETFRLRRISDSLCAILSAHHTFEPALDASGQPVEGSYEARISYLELRERQ